MNHAQRFFLEVLERSDREHKDEISVAADKVLQDGEYTWFGEDFLRAVQLVCRVRGQDERV